MTGSLHPPQSATATIPLRLARVRRAALLNALVGHGPPAFVLTAAGLGRLWAGATGPALALALAEAAAGLWQATVLVQEARESHHIERSRRLNRGAVAEERAGGAHAPDDSHGGRYSTPHLATGVLLAVEVWHHWHETGHVTRPFVLGALVFLAFGLGGYAALDPALDARIRARVREALTPHHVPRLVLAVPDLPRTLNGKLSEIAVRETVHGRPVRNLDALANPGALAHVRDHPRLRT
jgi:hypothetical protein